MTSILLLLAFSFFSNLDYLSLKTIELSTHSAIIESQILFPSVNSKDIKSLMWIETRNRHYLRGTSGEYGLLQLMPYFFEKNSPQVNDTLQDNNHELIKFDTTTDRLMPRSNILTGVYVLSKNKKKYKSIIYSAIAHNAGNSSVMRLKRVLKNKPKNWYCHKLSSSIRVSRTLMYSYRFAKKARRMYEWKKLFNIDKSLLKMIQSNKLENMCKSNLS
jgi:hypothetical protein